MSEQANRITLVTLACNLCSITTNQAAIIALCRVINRYVGNSPPLPGVFRIIRRLSCATPAPNTKWR